MITSPESNVVLSVEQQNAINLAEQRLANLQREFNKEIEKLGVARNDCESITKEKEYQAELLADITPKLEAKRAESTKLDESILEKVAQLNQLLVEFKEHSDKMEAEKMKIKDTQDRVATQEFEVSKKEQKLLSAAVRLETDKKEFDSKVAKLKEVIKDF